MRLVPLLLAASTLALCAEPIRPHPENPHYFLFRGNPMVIVSSAEHYGAVLNQDFNWRKYLDTMARDGMNYVRIFAGTYVEVPGDFGIERNTLAPATDRFIAPWPRVEGKYNLNEWNAAYFARLFDFVAEASRRGIIVELTLFCSTYTDKQWSVSPFNPANNNSAIQLSDWHDLHTVKNGGALIYQEKLTRKLVRDLNQFDNLFFEIQNEPWADRKLVAEVVPPNPVDPAAVTWPKTTELADDASIAWQSVVASWIISEELKLPNKHLIAQNVCNHLYRVRSLVRGAGIINFHYAHPEASLWNQGLNMPLAYDETGFIGNKDASYRKEAWRFILAGGGAFNHLDYSFSAGYEDGTDSQPKSPGGGSPALRKQFKVLSDFIHALPFLKMKPEPGLAVLTPKVRGQALSVPGEIYAVYLTGRGQAEFTLALPAGQYVAEGIEPATGSVLQKLNLDQREGALQLKTPEFSQDIALRITKAAR